jgi:hypothetical protein
VRGFRTTRLSSCGEEIFGVAVQMKHLFETHKRRALQKNASESESGCGCHPKRNIISI